MLRDAWEDTMQSAEKAPTKARILVVGRFSRNPQGQRFEVTADSFADEMARRAAEVAVEVKSGGEARRVEVSFSKLRAFSAPHLIAQVPSWAALKKLSEQLAKGELAQLSPEELEAQLAPYLGKGPALSALSPAKPSEAAPSSGQKADLVDELLARSPAGEAKSQVDAFIRDMRSQGSSGKVAPSHHRELATALEKYLAQSANEALASTEVAPLESSFRGLKLLVDQCPKSSSIGIDVLDAAVPVSIDAVREALSSDSFDEPDVCVLVDPVSPKQWVAWAELAEEANVPILCAAATPALGAETAEKLAAEPPHAPALPPEVEAARASDSARWLCVAVNPIVLFKEGQGSRERVCYGSPSLAVAAMLAQSFQHTGTFARIFGKPGALTAPASRDASGISIPTESFLAITAQGRLAERGLLGLGSGRNSDAIHLSQAPMLHAKAQFVSLPAQIFTGRVLRFAFWVRAQLQPSFGAEEISALFSQAAQVFLFADPNAARAVTGKVVDAAGGQRSLQVEANLPPELAGTPVELSFQLPLPK
jgi:hypothetical protein